MVKRITAFSYFVVLFLLISVSAGASYQVVDNAELFYNSEISQIEELAYQIDETYNMNVLVLTDREKNGLSASAKAENSYEALGFADNGANGGICIIIDMGNREVTLITDLVMQRFITDEREDEIIDVGYGYITNAEYGDAMISMLEKTKVFLKKGIPGNQYTYDSETGTISRYYAITLMDTGIALGGGVLLPLLVVLVLVSGYKKVGKYRYDLNSNARLNITASSDRMVSQYVTKRRINTEPKGGGSGHGGGRTTTHHSSSGRSYGGGHGRKF